MQLPAFHPRRVAGALCLALACAALAAPAYAQWKWRDSRGQIHVSDTPPPRDVPDKDVLQRPAPGASKAAPAGSAAAPSSPSAPASAASGATAARPTVDKELEQRKRQAEQEQAAKRKADDDKAAAVRADNCRRARDHLAVLESGQRIARIKPDGEREVLDDDQRAAEARRTREIIASDCR